MRGQSLWLERWGKNEDILHLISGESFSPWEDEKHLFQVRQRGRQGLGGSLAWASQLLKGFKD